MLPLCVRTVNAQVTCYLPAEIVSIVTVYQLHLFRGEF